MVRHAGALRPEAVRLRQPFAGAGRRINITSTRSHCLVHGDRVLADTRSHAPVAAQCRMQAQLSSLKLLSLSQVRLLGAVVEEPGDARCRVWARALVELLYPLAARSRIVAALLLQVR